MLAPPPPFFKGYKKLQKYSFWKLALRLYENCNSAGELNPPFTVIEIVLCIVFLTRRITMTTDKEQITIYSCHLCGFCETSLEALTKHTTIHIKPEPSKHGLGSRSGDVITLNESERDSLEHQHQTIHIIQHDREDSIRSGESQGAEARAAYLYRSSENARQMQNRINSPDVVIVPRQYARSSSPPPTEASNRQLERSHFDTSTHIQNSHTSRSRHGSEEVILVDENVCSPRAPGSYPSYPVSSSTQSTQSRLMFPSGWSDSRPNPPSESRVPVTSVRFPGGHYQQNFQTVSQVPVSNKQPQHIVSPMPRINHCHSVRSVASSARQKETMTSHSQKMIHYLNRQEVVREGRTAMNVQRRLPESHTGHRVIENTGHHPIHTDTGQSAFRPYGQPGHNQAQNLISPPSGPAPPPPPPPPPPQPPPQYCYQHPAPQMYQVNPSFQVPQYNGPVPLPNTGHLFMNSAQPIILPPTALSDTLSGFLVVPLKKTAEISTQTGGAEVVKVLSTGIQADIEEEALLPEDGLSAAEADSTEKHDKTPLKSPKKPPFYCHICRKSFQDTVQIKIHIESCHKEIDLKCKDCNKIFGSMKTLQAHRVKIHNKRMPFRCGVCSLRFEDRASVVSHLATHSNNLDDNLSCQNCGKICASEDALRKHILIHKPQTHICPDCGKKFGSEVTLAYHKDQVHGKERAEYQASVDRQVQGADPEVPASSNKSSGVTWTPDKNKDEELKCSSCSSTFSSQLELLGHTVNCRAIAESSLSKMLRCVACNTYFATKTQLVNHYNAAHLSKDGYVCPKCSKKFRLWSRLKIHIKTYHKIIPKKHPCKTCGAKFNTQEALLNHVQHVHEAKKTDRIYTCKLCKNIYSTLTDLMVHRRAVHNLNPLESTTAKVRTCPYCGMKKLTRKMYVVHLREVHQIMVQDRKAGKLNRKVPEAINTDVSPSAVQSVSQNSSKSDTGPAANRKGQQVKGQEAKVHSSVRVTSPKEMIAQEFPCRKCGATFSDHKRLLNHLGLVHNEKPFSCELCDRKFAYSGQVVWHMRDHRRKKTAALARLAREKKGDKDSDSQRKPVVSLEKVVTHPAKVKSPTIQTSSKIFKCRHCSTCFTEEKRLNNHMGVRHGYKLFKCDICCLKFSYSTHLIWHRRGHFTDRKPDNKGKEARGHELQQGKKRKLSEVDDGDTSSQPSEEPDVEMVVGEEEDDNGEKWFMCGYCNKNFANENTFRKHMLKHKGKRELGCETCGRTFKYPNQLQVHRLSHRNNTATETVEGEENVVINKSDQGTPDALEEDESETAKSLHYTCEFCNKELPTFVGWKVHRTRCHGVTDDGGNFSPSGTLKKGQKDDMNDNDSQTSSILTGDSDKGSTEENVWYTCVKCKQKYNSLRGIRTHHYRAHGISKEEIPIDQIEVQSDVQDDPNLEEEGLKMGHEFLCGTCNHEFTTEKGMRIHCKKMEHIPTEPEKHDQPSKDSSASLLQADVTQKSTTGDQMPNQIPPKPPKTPTKVLDPQGYKCPRCSVVKVGYLSIRMHMYKVHNEFPTKEGLLPFRVDVDVPVTDTPSSIHKKQKLDHDVSVNKSRPGSPATKDASSSATTPATKALQYPNSSNNVTKSPLSWSSLSFKCPKCDKEFLNKRGVATHLRVVHSIFGKGVFDSMVASEVDSDVPQTEKVPISQESLRSILNEETTKCPICNRLFQNRRGITTHLVRYHNYEREDFKLPKHLMKNVPQFEVLEHDDDAIIFDVQEEYGVGESSEEGHPSYSRLENETDKPLNDVNDEARNDDKIAATPDEVQCQICLRAFPSIRSFQTHQYKAHGIKGRRGGVHAQFKTNMQDSANSSLTDNENLQINGPGPDQRTDVSKDENIADAKECPVCNGRFVGRRGLTAHVTRIHRFNAIELAFLFQTNERAVNTQCLKCSRKFQNESTLTVHRYFVHSSDSAVKSSFDTEVKHSSTNVTDPEEHVEMGESMKSPTESARDSLVTSHEKQNYVCLNCESRFGTSYSLLVHLIEQCGKNSPEDAGIDDSEGLPKEPLDVSIENERVEAKSSSNQNKSIASETESTVNSFTAARDPDNDGDGTRDTDDDETESKSLSSVCNVEFDNEHAHRIHYTNAHGRNLEDPHVSPEGIDLDTLETDVLSKEYRLRNTNSSKAVLGEVEWNDLCLALSPGRSSKGDSITPVPDEFPEGDSSEMEERACTENTAEQEPIGTEKVVNVFDELAEAKNRQTAVNETMASQDKTTELSEDSGIVECTEKDLSPPEKENELKCDGEETVEARSVKTTFAAALDLHALR